MLRWLYCSIILLVAARVLAQDTTLHIEHLEQFGNVTIAFLTGPEQTTHSYMTLEEGLRTKKAVIHERNSQTLHIDNIGDKDLFVQSGDLIKGGQQDRMIANDQILDPQAMTKDLEVFCIEQGRSTKRGDEPLEIFSSSERSAPLPHLRAMAKHEMTAMLLKPHVGGMTAPDPQQLEMLQDYGVGSSAPVPFPFQATDPAQEAIWHDVADLQSGLTSALHDSVTKTISPTSLELTLERTADLKAAKRLNEELSEADRPLNAIGYLYAVGGVIYGGDVYGSHALFESMWPKLARSIVPQALAMDTARGVAKAPDFEDYLRPFAFATEVVRQSNERTEVHVSESKNAYRFVTYDVKLGDGQNGRACWIHQQYVTK